MTSHEGPLVKSDESDSSSPERLTEEQRELVADHTYLLDIIADERCKDLPKFIRREDLVEQGTLGLIDAAINFEPTRAKFSTYAKIRIRCAIADWLRKQPWAPRLIAAEARKNQEIIDALENELQRKPTDEEIKERVGADAVLSAKEMIDNLDASAADSKADNPLDIASDADRREVIDSLIKKELSELEQSVILMRYFDKIPVNEIQTTLNLTHDQYYRLHHSALKKLHRVIGAKRESFI